MGWMRYFCGQSFDLDRWCIFTIFLFSLLQSELSHSITIWFKVFFCDGRYLRFLWTLFFVLWWLRIHLGQLDNKIKLWAIFAYKPIAVQNWKDFVLYLQLCVICLCNSVLTALRQRMKKQYVKAFQMKNRIRWDINQKGSLRCFALFCRYAFFLSSLLCLYLWWWRWNNSLTRSGLTPRFLFLFLIYSFFFGYSGSWETKLSFICLCPTYLRHLFEIEIVAKIYSFDIQHGHMYPVWSTPFFQFSERSTSLFVGFQMKVWYIFIVHKKKNSVQNLCIWKFVFPLLA